MKSDHFNKSYFLYVNQLTTIQSIIKDSLYFSFNYLFISQSLSLDYTEISSSISDDLRMNYKTKQQIFRFILIKRLVANNKRRNLNMLQQTTSSSQSPMQQPETEKSHVDYSLFKAHTGSLQSLEVSHTTNNDRKYNSSRLDNLLYSSFVQIDRFVQRQELTFNIESGDSFFKRSNNLFFSDFGKRQSQKMSHKKVQCEIGKGLSLAEAESQANLLSKYKTLQVLKMIKLIRIIFKKLRQSIATVKQEVSINISQSQKLMMQISEIFSDKISVLTKSMEEKSTRINELQRQTGQLNEQSVKLKQELNFQIEQNNRLLKYIQQQTEKNFVLINKLQDQKEDKLIELNQKIDRFQFDQSMLHEEINHLNDIILDNERQFKKLEYEKKNLQHEYSDLLKRNQDLLKKQDQNDFSFNQQCIVLQRSNSEINQLMRLNQFYLKEIQSCKQEIQKVKEENRDIKRQGQLYVAEQLENIGEYFQQKYSKLESYWNRTTPISHHAIDILQTQQENQRLQKINEKRKISVISFREDISSFKKGTQFEQFSGQVNNCLPSQKENQNKLNLGHKKLTKHLSQQMKEPIMLESKQKCGSAISSSEFFVSDQTLIFKAKQHHKGKIKLADFFLPNNQSSKIRYVNTSESTKNDENFQLSDCRKKSKVF